MNPQRFMTIPPDEYRRPTPTNPNALRLDSNEGATPDAALLAAIGDTAASELRNYPHVAPLQRALAARWHIAEDGVVVTTGADDALDRCCRAFLGPDRSVVLPLPSFEMLHRFIEMTGADVRPVDWTAARFPVEEVIAAVRSDTGLVVIISPNNPTGSVASADDLRRVARAAPDAVVLLDHAYVEYADEDLTAAALALPNVVTVRTFSKAWGLAGCRVGYALTTPELARPLRNAGNPYPVAAPSIKAALHQLTHGEAMLEDHVALVRAERQRTLALLDELEVTTPLSEGNFVFPDFRDRSDVTDAILQFGGVLGRRFPHRANISGGIRISMPADADQLGILHHALRLAVRPDALLFDLDGVIADVSGSYRECVIRTVAHYGAQVTVDELQTIKLAGDANNDWVVTRRVLARRRIDVPLPGPPRHGDPWRVRSLDGR